MVKGLERDAKRSVSTAQWLGLLAALLTLGASLLAGLRIRTAVQGLHVTNDELEALSTNLADANATLEHKVEARTLALAKRETSVRRLLDGLEEGVVSMNPDGTLRQERSLAVERWFGPQTSATQHAWSYFFSESEDQQALLEMGLEQIQDGFLPFELCVDQLPARTHFQDRVYQIRYQPEYLDGSLEAILMILTDVTAMLEAERLQKEARCFQELIERALCDPCGFQQFLQGGEVLLESLKRTEEEATVKHVLHTLKGNSAIFGFEPMAELCHEIEDALEEREVALLMGPELQRLALLWDSMRKRIAVFLEDRNDACVILRHEIQAWRAAIERGEDPADLLRQLDTWLLEPTRVNLERVAQHTHRLARRMGHEIEVDIQSHGVYTEPGFAKEVWNEAIHLIRNALVHGIESETEREQLGKPTRGKITLATDLDEDRALHIRISDDGRGIDWERLSERAQALGLPPET